jgi:branched-chain amino acid transport system permease protein
MTGGRLELLVLVAGLGLAAALANATLGAYELTLIGFAGINVMLAVSLSFSNGLTGLFSLGHPAFMMIGGYIAAVLTYPANRKAFMLPDLPPWLAGAEWGLLPATIAGAAGAAAVAVVVGFPVLRLRGHYLAVATLGLIIIVRVLINNADGLTRGALGLSGIPRLSGVWSIYAGVVVTLVACWRLKHSSVGRSLMAVRDNELAAASIGIRLAASRLAAFALGAACAGAAGALWAHLVGNLTPASFGIPLAFTLVAMVVLGGTGSLTGAVIAALALSLLTDALRPLEQAAGLYGLTQIIVALLLIGSMILRPAGLFGGREPRFGRKRPAPFRTEPSNEREEAIR